MSGIAIIGAGVAGLAAARKVRLAGRDCVVFEKSGGLGGRMATRRAAGMRFDHGAQFFTARGERFRILVEQWLREGHVSEWFDGAFVGTPDMTAPAQAMAEGQCCLLESLVTSLTRDRDGWTVNGADGPLASGFSAVLLATPAPQAAGLLASAGLVFPELARARYAPCWALMLAYPEPVGLPDDRVRLDDETIALVVRDASKPMRERAAETLVVHAAPEWSRRNLELSVGAAAVALRESFEARFGVKATPSFAAAHRWRYALVEQAAGAAFVWDEVARVGACGDWALGPRIEAAFDSGEALADALLASGTRR